MFARRVDETYNRGRFRADEEREITAEVESGQDRFMPAARKDLVRIEELALTLEQKYR
jgi:hypothetical protein